MRYGVIFDMDGVISDTQRFHAVAESAILKTYGIDMAPAAITSKYAGVADDEMFKDILAHHKNITANPQNLVKQKWNLMAKSASGKIKAIPGAVELIKSLKRNSFKLAVASSSPKAFIDEVIASLKLNTYFDVLVSSDEVESGKPNPDIFLLAASKIDTPPEHTIVIEDGLSGMVAAKEAGMKCIGLVEDIKADYPATILVSSLKEVDVNYIKALYVN